MDDKNAVIALSLGVRPSILEKRHAANQAAIATQAPQIQPYPSTNGSATLTPMGPLTPERRKAIAAWLKDDAAPLYGYCSKLAAEHLGEGASPVQLGAAADCLFNAARDRFGF